MLGGLADERSNGYYADVVTEKVEQIPVLDVAAMVADMRPPTDDDFPIALDGTGLDTPAKVIAHLQEINARRAAADKRAS